MAIKLGNVTPSDIYLGSNWVRSIYLGSLLVWGLPAPSAPEEILNLSPSTSYYPTAGGGSRTITVTSSGQWSATVSSLATSWLHISRSTGTSGQTCVISCDAQSSFSSRSGSVTFNCGSLSQTISVVQAGEEYSIEVSPTSMSGSSSGYTSSFSVTANCNWEVSCSGWIHTSVSQGSGNVSNITVTVDANTGDARTGYIAVNEEDGHTTTSIEVSQSGVVVQATAIPRAINWKYDSNDTYANKQSWQVEFHGGSTNKTFTNVTVVARSMDSGYQEEPVVSGQTVTVPANGTVYLGLNQNDFADHTKAQLSYNGFTVNDDPYVLLVYGDNLSSLEVNFDEQYIYD